jgi:ATP-dependent exoDNAse (exonuclease V) beta subunit
VRTLGVTGTQLWDVDPTRDTARSVLRRVSPEDADALPQGNADLPAIDFAAWYQRRDLDDLMPEQGQTDVVVMTTHASKGLEFGSVVVAGLGHSMGRDMNDREEANLVYVACTRAKDELALVGDPSYTAKLTD